MTGVFLVVRHNDDKPTTPVSSELIGWVLDRHAAALELYARQLCDCPEDAVQESIIQLARQPQVPRDVVPWLYRVVRNRAISNARSARRRRRREAEAGIQGDAFFETDPDNKVDGEVVQSALALLPTEQREVIVAHLWGGMTFKEIGQFVGITDSTAHRRYQAGVQALQTHLGASCPKTETRNTTQK